MSRIGKKARREDEAVGNEGDVLREKAMKDSDDNVLHLASKGLASSKRPKSVSFAASDDNVLPLASSGPVAAVPSGMSLGALAPATSLPGLVPSPRTATSLLPFSPLEIPLEAAPTSTM